MTITLPIAWTGLMLAVVGVVYALIRDFMDGKRIDQLEKLTAGLRGDITDMIRDHRRDLAAVQLDLEAGRFWKDTDPAPGIFAEPATQPIVRVPTDTVDQAAAIDAGLRKLHGATASGGRHRRPA